MGLQLGEGGRRSGKIHPTSLLCALFIFEVGGRWEGGHSMENLALSGPLSRDLRSHLVGYPPKVRYPDSPGVPEETQIKGFEGQKEV